jgi:adenosyl cobinamide kinase/adenosyl cobinamide phosphate guanylyltransferase
VSGATGRNAVRAGTAQALAALIFTGSDTGIDIVGEDEPTRRFRQLIGSMAATVGSSA